MKDYKVLVNPLTTEKSVRLMETENKLVFKINNRANKKDVKKAVENLFSVKVKKVNTHNRLDGKIAYVTLTGEYNAMDIATELGVI